MSDSDDLLSRITAKTQGLRSEVLPGGCEAGHFPIAPYRAPAGIFRYLETRAIVREIDQAELRAAWLRGSWLKVAHAFRPEADPGENTPLGGWFAQLDAACPAWRAFEVDTVFAPARVNAEEEGNEVFHFVAWSEPGGHGVVMPRVAEANAPARVMGFGDERRPEPSEAPRLTLSMPSDAVTLPCFVEGGHSVRAAFGAGADLDAALEAALAASGFLRSYALPDSYEEPRLDELLPLFRDELEGARTLILGSWAVYRIVSYGRRAGEWLGWSSTCVWT